MSAINTHKQRGFTPIVVIVIVAVATLLMLFGITVMAYGFNVAKSGGCTAAQVLHYVTAGQNKKMGTLKEVCDLLGGGKDTEDQQGVTRIPIGRHTLSGQFTSLQDAGIPQSTQYEGPAEIDSHCVPAAQEIFTVLGQEGFSGEEGDERIGVRVIRSHIAKEGSYRSHQKGYALDITGEELQSSNFRELETALINSQWATDVDNYLEEKEKSFNKGHIHIELFCSPASTISQTSCSSIFSENIKIPVPKKEWMTFVQEAATRHLNGDQAMLIALIGQESSWISNAATDKSSAQGLGQFVEQTAKSRAEFAGGTDRTGTVWSNGYTDNQDPRLDPKRSIFAAASYLRDGLENTSATKDSKTGVIGCSNNQRPDLVLGCTYLYSYHRGCATGDPAKCAEGEKGREKIEELYRYLISKKACVATTINQPAPSGVNACGEEIINYARRFIGTPYFLDNSNRYGHCAGIAEKENPGLIGHQLLEIIKQDYYLDCSGFISRVYRDLGLLPSNTCTSTSAIRSLTRPRIDNKYLVKISKSELMPGDLMNVPGKHIWIFAGGNPSKEYQLVESHGCGRKGRRCPRPGGVNQNGGVTSRTVGTSGTYGNATEFYRPASCFKK